MGTLGRWVCSGAIGLTLATVGAATVYQRSNALAGEITFMGEVLSPHRDGDYPRQRLPAGQSVGLSY